MKKFLLAGMAVLFLAGCNQTAPANDTVETDSAETSVMVDDVGSMTDTKTVILAEQNDSGQMGTATLEEINGQVVVTLSMTGEPSDVPQPAHIHVGSCPEPGAVQFPLTSVEAGSSVTTVDTTLAQLEDMMPLAINVHKSAEEASVYTSCGDL